MNLTFDHVSAPCSTAVSQTCSSRTSSLTPTTPASLSLPSSPIGEEEEEEEEDVDDFVCHLVVTVEYSLSVRVVKAGTELTWNYSADPQRKQEVSCLCRSNSCQGHFFIENLCDMYEGESESQ